MASFPIEFPTGFPIEPPRELIMPAALQHGSLVFSGIDKFDYFRGLEAVTSDTTLTLGPGFHIRGGNAEIGRNIQFGRSYNLVNQGTILALGTNDPDFINRRLDLLDQVTLADLQRVAQQYLSPTRRRTLLTLSPPAEEEKAA